MTPWSTPTAASLALGAALYAEQVRALLADRTGQAVDLDPTALHRSTPV